MNFPNTWFLPLGAFFLALQSSLVSSEKIVFPFPSQSCPDGFTDPLLQYFNTQRQNEGLGLLKYSSRLNTVAHQIIVHSKPKKNRAGIFAREFITSGLPAIYETYGRREWFQSDNPFLTSTMEIMREDLHESLYQRPFTREGRRRKPFTNKQWASADEVGVACRTFLKDEEGTAYIFVTFGQPKTPMIQVPTTPEPTTPEPTTPQPTTPVPTTRATTTTPKPTTQVPTTQKSRTRAPKTPKPTTRSPTTQKSTTRAPRTPKPRTRAPRTPKPPTPGFYRFPNQTTTCPASFSQAILHTFNLHREIQNLAPLVLAPELNSLAIEVSTQRHCSNKCDLHLERRFPNYGAILWTDEACKPGDDFYLSPKTIFSEHEMKKKKPTYFEKKGGIGKIEFSENNWVDARKMGISCTARNDTLEIIFTFDGGKRQVFEDC